jgi:peptide/nickel transport system ATP-binding protein
MSHTNKPLFNVSGLKKQYPVREKGFLSSLNQKQRYLKAVDDVNFVISEGEIVGLAGQSGSGKSTLGELLLGLQKPSEGKILHRGKNLQNFTKDDWIEFRHNCQVIFQDPYESLNPRLTVEQIVMEPLKIHAVKVDRTEKILNALRDAGLSPPEKYLPQLPSELSGGERQRVSIAQALVLNPDVLIADEPVSMLDVSVSTSLLNLFKRLQQSRDLTMIYISHDLATIRYLTDVTMIMYLGKIVEKGPTEKVIDSSAHPYTEQLVSAVPDPDPEIERGGSDIGADEADPIDLPTGCRFRPYCEYSSEKCVEVEPELEDISDRGSVACYHPLNQ